MVLVFSFNICMAYGLQWDIHFNPIKSQLACFGGKYPDCDCISIGGKIINCSDRINIGQFSLARGECLTLTLLLNVIPCQYHHK